MSYPVRGEVLLRILSSTNIKFNLEPIFIVLNM